MIPGVEEVLPDGVPLIEVPLRPETAARYGDTPTTGRHPLLDDWIGDRAARGAGRTAPTSLIYTSGTTGLPKGVLRDAMEPEQSPRSRA